MRPIVTNVRIINGAQAAYACIQATTCTLDVQLHADLGTLASLTKSAAELREQARRLLQRANLIDQAKELI